MATAPSPAIMLSYLTGTLGYSPAQAAALLGNARQESSLNPAALNKNEGAYGLFQWRGDRLSGLNQFATANGMSPADWRTQLNYAKFEMGGPEAKSSARFLSAQTIPQANAALHQYIRYGDNSEGTRLKYAENLAPQYASVNSAPLTPGTQAPPLPPPINVGSAPAVQPFNPTALALAPQQQQQQQQAFSPMAMARLMGGTQTPAPQAPQMPQNPVQAMAFAMPPPDTRGLQQLLSQAPALRGLIV